MNNQSPENFNLNIYESERIAAFYAHQDFLFKAESEIFGLIAEKLNEMDVLDVGIGGGRTTYYLANKCKTYLGIDYSQNMIHKAKQNFPALNFRCEDARNLDFASNASFDFVFFSYNGIDSVSYEDRNLILKELYRVLRPGGFFAFSSHNKDYKYFDKFPWQQNLPLTLNNIKHCLKVMLHLPRILKLRRKNTYSSHYAHVLDEAHFYSLYNFYISPSAQINDLKDIGFTEIRTFHKNGGEISNYSDTDFVYYLCKKK
jgi:ubiquinone/menaquinone biosynthesis C-methylase UbiE